GRRRVIVGLVLLVLVVVDEAEVHGCSPPDRSHGKPYPCTISGCGRGPNSAVPSRTIVAPSATATSRSSLIPKETSGSPSAAASAASRRKPGRADAGSPPAPTAITPRTSSPRARRPSASAGASSQPQPFRP